MLAGEPPGFGSHATVGKCFGESSVPEGRVRAVTRFRILPGICLKPEKKL